MKIHDIKPPAFDPTLRMREMKVLHVAFSPKEWCEMERSLGKYVSPTEIRELILGVFSGEFKIVRG